MKFRASSSSIQSQSGVGGDFSLGFSGKCSSEARNLEIPGQFPPCLPLVSGKVRLNSGTYYGNAIHLRREHPADHSKGFNSRFQMADSSKGLNSQLQMEHPPNQQENPREEHSRSSSFLARFHVLRRLGNRIGRSHRHVKERISARESLRAKAAHGNSLMCATTFTSAADTFGGNANCRFPFWSLSRNRAVYDRTLLCEEKAEGPPHLVREGTGGVQSMPYPVNTNGFNCHGPAHGYASLRRRDDSDAEFLSAEPAVKVEFPNSYLKPVGPLLSQEPTEAFEDPLRAVANAYGDTHQQLENPTLPADSSRDRILPVGRKVNTRTDVDFASLGNQAIMTFGKTRLRLEKHLSARTHCQFQVWEAELLDDVYSASDIGCPHKFFGMGQDPASSIAVPPNGSNDDTSGELPIAIPAGRKIALKFVHIDCGTADNGKRIDKSCLSRLRYKTQSLSNEGRYLREIAKNAKISTTPEFPYFLSVTNEMGNTPTGKSRRIRRLPTPDYYWTGAARIYQKKATDTSAQDSAVQMALAVAMEPIRGRPLTRLLGRLTGQLALEAALKIVEAQKLLAEDRNTPLVNWDTKPGNILLEFSRIATSGRLHCRRAVIIDLGDALPGPSYMFPTKQRRQPGTSLNGGTPGYIICTKGFCAPECAMLVFLLSSTPRCTSFRKAWYGVEPNQNKELERMMESRRFRIQRVWREFISTESLRVISPTPTHVPQSISAYSTIASAIDRTTTLTAPSMTAMKSPKEPIKAGASSPSSARLLQQFKQSDNDLYLINQLDDLTGSRLDKNDKLDDLTGSRLDKNDKSNVSVHPVPDNSSAAVDKTLTAHAEGTEDNADKSGESTVRSGGWWNTWLWEIEFSEATVVFSTGLVLAQLFGNRGIMSLVGKNETAAVDALCEWGSAEVFQDSGASDLISLLDGIDGKSGTTTNSPPSHSSGNKVTYNSYTNSPNLSAKDLLPRVGIFANEPWFSRVAEILEGCLAFVPRKRWSFARLETSLKTLLSDYREACPNDRSQSLRFDVNKAENQRLTNFPQEQLMMFPGDNTSSRHSKFCPADLQKPHHPYEGLLQYNRPPINAGGGDEKPSLVAKTNHPTNRAASLARPSGFVLTGQRRPAAHSWQSQAKPSGGSREYRSGSYPSQQQRGISINAGDETGSSMTLQNYRWKHFSSSNRCASTRPQGAPPHGYMKQPNGGFDEEIIRLDQKRRGYGVPPNSREWQPESRFVVDSTKQARFHALGKDFGQPPNRLPPTYRPPAGR